MFFTIVTIASVNFLIYFLEIMFSEHCIEETNAGARVSALASTEDVLVELRVVEVSEEKGVRVFGEFPNGVNLFFPEASVTAVKVRVNMTE